MEKFYSSLDAPIIIYDPMNVVHPTESPFKNYKPNKKIFVRSKSSVNKMVILPRRDQPIFGFQNTEAGKKFMTGNSRLK